MILKLHKLIDFLAYWWHRATTSRYVLHLELEVKRLQAENVAMRDTVFGLRGFPPPARPMMSPDLPAIVREQAAQAQAPTPAKVSLRARKIHPEGDAIRTEQKAAADKVASLRREFQRAVEDDKIRANNQGYAIPAGASSPVKVEDSLGPVTEPTEEAS
jgi:hypothetical protein